MARILVADDDPRVRRVVERTLGVRGHAVELVDSGSAALTAVSERPPELTILDASMPGPDGTQVARTLRETQSTRQMPILLLTVMPGEVDTLTGLPSGGDEHLTKPINPRELAAVVDAMLARHGIEAPARARPEGQVIVVAGPKGGVGRTTVACNLALAVQSHAPSHRTILVDGNFALGDLGVHLDLRGQSSMLDLVPYAGRITVDAVENILLRHRSGLQVMIRPAASERVDNIPASLVREVLCVAAGIGDVVILDLGAGHEDDRSLEALELASTILLVVTPDLGSLRNARYFLDVAPRLGIDPGMVRVVLNRHHDRAGLSQRDVLQVLNMADLVQLPEMGPSATEHLNLGSPVVESDPRSDFSRRIVALASTLVGSRGAAATLR